MDREPPSPPPRSARRSVAARAPLRTATVATCAAFALVATLFAATQSRAAAPRRVGLVIVASAAEADDAAAAFRSAPWPGDEGVVFLERRVTDGADGAREAVARLAQDGVDAIALLDDDAGTSRPVVHGCQVIGAAPTAPVSASDTAVRVRGGLLAAELRDAVARLVGDARRVGYLTLRPDDDVLRAPGAADGPFVTVRPVGGTPRERAEDARSRLVPRCDVICVAPDVPAEDVGALATALEGAGIPIVGSRRAHLDAGASVVLRTAPADVGRLTATLVLAATSGGDLRQVRGAPPAAPRRIVREVHLGNARRMSFAIPLLFLAAADRIVPAPAVRK